MLLFLNSVVFLKKSFNHKMSVLFHIFVLFSLINVAHNTEPSPMCKNYISCKCTTVKTPIFYDIEIRCENNRYMKFLEIRPDNETIFIYRFDEIRNIILSKQDLENYHKSEKIELNNLNIQILDEDLIKGTK